MFSLCAICMWHPTIPFDNLWQNQGQSQQEVKLARFCLLSREYQQQIFCKHWKSLLLWKPFKIKWSNFSWNYNNWKYDSKMIYISMNAKNIFGRFFKKWHSIFDCIRAWAAWLDSKRRFTELKCPMKSSNSPPSHTAQGSPSHMVYVSAILTLFHMGSSTP